MSRSFDTHLHLDPYFGDSERAFCPCGEELVFQQEFDATKCLKCIQDEEAKGREEEE